MMIPVLGVGLISTAMPISAINNWWTAKSFLQNSEKIRFSCFYRGAELCACLQSLLTYFPTHLGLPSILPHNFTYALQTGAPCSPRFEVSVSSCARPALRTHEDFRNTPHRDSRHRRRRCAPSFVERDNCPALPFGYCLLIDSGQLKPFEW